MERKYKTLQKIYEVGIVAVVRAETPQKAIAIAEATMEGGIPLIEIAFTVPGAHKVIAALREKLLASELTIGAGTVMDSETARIAILEGAEYIVGPGFNLETAKLCNRYKIPYMPGCITITEMIGALEAGVDVIKLFPGSAVGPDYVKAIKGPLPQAEFMPTGGVNLDNVAQWIRNGCIA